MDYVRLLKYPGSKKSALPDIEGAFRNSGCTRLVDVFGGSGSVSLNILSRETVYNDTSTQLSGLFSAIQQCPEEMQRSFSRLLKNVEGKGENAEKLNRAARLLGETDLREAVRGIADECSEKVQRGLATLLENTARFGGMGDTYSTVKEKSPYRSMKRALETLPLVSGRVHGWKVESMDFRKLVDLYDGAGTFFYFDPPYPGKDWYGTTFSINDYTELAKIVRSLMGKYLLNLDDSDAEVQSIFGKPSFTRRYKIRYSGRNPGNGAYRLLHFYTNF